MNCSAIRNRLPLLLYDDLCPVETANIEKHLAACAACQREFEALQGVQQNLGLLAAPTVQIDLTRFYRRAAALQERGRRRWRRLAFATVSAAAILLGCVLTLRLEARVEGHQFVLRWGSPPEGQNVVAPPAQDAKPEIARTVEKLPVAAATEEQIRLLSELIHALADNVQSVERREQQDTAQLQTRLLALQHQNAQRWSALERTVESLYQSVQKGE